MNCVSAALRSVFRSEQEDDVGGRAKQVRWYASQFGRRSHVRGARRQGLRGRRISAYASCMYSGMVVCMCCPLV